MEISSLHQHLKQLEAELEGDISIDLSHRLMYATDASAYRELPLGIARPKNRYDLIKLIRFAGTHNVPLIPRAAGTSLAGQVVGPGLVVDISRYMTRIIEFNPAESWVRVEPGVILDELNRYAEPHGLFFGSETSTSSRCMIGGMVGNNSCGAHSIIFGSTRDHLLSVRTLLSDGSEVEFCDISIEELQQKLKSETLEGRIYRQLHKTFTDPETRDSIRREYPDPSIHRRNTGYAIDLVMEMAPFTSSPQHHSNTAPLNLSKLLAGSEGTLAFITEIKLNLVPLPPKEKAVVCVHCTSVEEALKGNLIALKYNPGSVELMDKAILDCTKENIGQRRNRFFLEGDPGAILIVEFARNSRKEIEGLAEKMETEMREAGYGYAFPVIFLPEMTRVWALRKAGLGALSNYPGDRKPVAVTEDTAVAPEMLSSYIKDFGQLLERLGLNCVCHAHVGSGELHLRPVLNLKEPQDVELFHTVAIETAKLVKKYNGSLSGEHGDGRLRGEFIPLMIGDRNYRLLQEIKQTWDPDNIFNPGKIIDTPRMTTSLRYDPDTPVREIETIFDFSANQGILRAAEQCNGSGDCRNTILTGQWMCPSYMALKDEHTTTRARANILREFLTNSSGTNPFDHAEIYEIMDLCLSCKACKSECPSNVDMTKLKAEFLQHWYDANGTPLRSQLIAFIPAINRFGALFPGLFNFIQQNRLVSGVFKTILNISPHRSLPRLYKTTFRSWLSNHLHELNSGLSHKQGSLYLFVDEFTNFNDVEVGVCFIRLLNSLGYEVLICDHDISGRTFLSKGLLRRAKKHAIRNVERLSPIITEKNPLVGLEPSAILGFRDEYPDLVGKELKEKAKNLADHTLLYDEFLVREMDAGRITLDSFTKDKAAIKLHGHCHQKALTSVEPSLNMLSLPENYDVVEVKSGCCGMAGSFGYEKEHYDLSMKVGELVLFPEIRKAPEDVVISAPGTSCRQQIMDGTGRKAYHPVEVLWKAVLHSDIGT